MKNTSFRINIPENVQMILDKLNDNGFSAFIVGGALRNTMLNIPVNDWDIATSANPNEVMKVFENFDIIPTGLKHGTVTINIDDEFMAEVTTFRVDGEYSDGRRPDNVAFTANIIEDLKRRDFTINAMAYNDRVGLIDPFHGRRDIRNKVVRCVGNPYDRFNEDALRILRAIRFAAQLEFYIDGETSNAIYGCMHLLNRISRERIQSELCKILNSNHCGYKQLSEYADVVNEFIPGFHLFFKKRMVMKQFWKYVETDNNAEDIITRLALLFDDANVAKDILTRLKFSKQIIVNTSQLVDCYCNTDFESLSDKAYIKCLMSRLDDKQFKRLLTIKRRYARADLDKHPDNLNHVSKAYDIYNAVLANEECYTLKQLAVNGHDLIGIGIKVSKDIGMILDMLLNLVIHDDVKNDKETLLKVVKEGL